RSTAVGAEAEASGVNSTALGRRARAIGEEAVAIGQGVTANTGQVRIGNSSIGDVQIGIFDLGRLRNDINAANTAIGSHRDIANDRGSLHSRINQIIASSLNSGTGLQETAVRMIIVNEADSGSIADAIVFALYGDPTGSIENPGGNAIAPAAESVVGRVQRGTLRSAADNAAGRDTNGDIEGNGGYRRAPVTGAGSHAPNSAADRRIVVQDTNQDGSVILGTLPFDALDAGRRVSELENDISGLRKRVDQQNKDLSAGVAMAMAMQAQSVPGKRINMSFGAASYNEEFATALTLGWRLHENLLINTGAGWATSGEQFGVRGGITFGW
ncbi:MAG: YadA-like family protein, partial [Candidatus Dadabacteria bacterium]|nr:YadA-like family protein [Candidatus Dadabacteria bacterium]